MKDSPNTAPQGKSLTENQEQPESLQQQGSSSSPAISPEVIQEMAERIGPMLDDPHMAEKIAHTSVKIVEQHHSGPLPSPQALQQYEEILPGCADRMVKMAETQLAHQQAMDTKDREIAEQYHDSQADLVIDGRTKGLFALAILVGAAIFSGMMGHWELAAVFMIPSAMGVIAQIVSSHKSAKEDTKSE